MAARMCLVADLREEGGRRGWGPGGRDNNYESEMGMGGHKLAVNRHLARNSHDTTAELRRARLHTIICVSDTML